MTDYSVDALRAAYGEFEVRRETFTVSDDEYDAVRADADRDALGGARVLVTHDDMAVLISNRGEDGWDIPGGGREPGEPPEETACRELREEVGLDVSLTGVLAVFEFGFVQEFGGGRVAGNWVHFAAVPTNGISLDVQEAELSGAGWFEDAPANLNEYAEPAVESFFE